MSLNSPRQQSVKNVARNQTDQVREMRNINRQNLLNRLKALRMKNIDKFRDIRNDANFACILEVRKLLRSMDESMWGSEEEKIAFIEKLEEELMLIAAEEHEKQTQIEIDCLLEALSSHCIYCQIPVSGRDICDKCLNEN